MLSADFQRRIAAGERDAFQTLYSKYGRGIYLHAMTALNDAEKSQQVVKQSFLALHKTICISADAPVDADRILDDAAESAIAAFSAQKRNQYDGKPATPAAPFTPPASFPLRGEATSAQRAASSYDDPLDSYTPTRFAADEDDDDLDAYGAPEEAMLPNKRYGKRGKAPDEAEELLERVRARVPANASDAPQEDVPRKRGSGLGNAILAVFLVVFLLLFLWILTGILMDFNLLPRIDLGFSWFNENIFRLFSL